MCTYVAEIFSTSSCTVVCNQLPDVDVAAMSTVICFYLYCTLNKRDKLMNSMAGQAKRYSPTICGSRQEENTIRSL